MYKNIHTSDRILFKRCRRKWNWASPLRQNLRPKSESIEALWFGNAIHFALEDHHGYNYFGDATKAVVAFYDAHVKGNIAMPEGSEELIKVKGIKMLEHFLDWETRQETQFETVWIDGVPQVEAEWEIPLPPSMCRDKEDIKYSMKLDRVMKDTFGRWWIRDYKTAAQFDTNKLETDPQVSAYLLFANWVYEVEFEGMSYVQLKKDYPKPPLELVSGGLSMNKNQSTTRRLYIEALRKMYGDRVPAKYVAFVKRLKEQEQIDGDKFVRETFVRRNPEALDSELVYIEHELTEMLDPYIALYPNPTRDCFWDCQFRSPCIAQNDGGDYDLIIEENYVQKDEAKSWRDYLALPTQSIKSGEDC